jgi:PQQ enzyme-like repeat protein
MRRALASLAAGLAVTGAALGAPPPDVIHVAKPAFPPPLAEVRPSGELRLAAISTRSRSPGALWLHVSPEVPRRAPATLAGARRSRVFGQPGTTFVIYGTGILAAFGPRGEMKYAFDLRSFGFPPRSLVPRAYGPQELVWARQLGRTLVVQTAHLGYATDSGSRNGYLTAIDIDTGKVRWRSPSLVANAQTFVVVHGVIVSGYGFTAERDWLYLIDPATGRVRDRLALPSMAERIEVRDHHLVVRCYDAWVVAGLTSA